MIFSLLNCGGGESGQRKIDTDKTKPSDESQPIRGKAKGVATIFDNDKALARDRALGDARNKLVETVLGSTLSGQSLMKDYELVSIMIESKSYGLVKKEKILGEGSEDTMYWIEIEGTVEPAVVEDAIEDALNRYGKPKFMVLINETFEGKVNMPGFTETEMLIQSNMGNSGFEFVDAQMTQEMMKRQKARMNNAINGQINEDVQNLLLNDIGAEVIIIGTAQTQDQSNAIRGISANLKSKSSIVRIKAIDVYTGKLLGATSENAPGAHTDSETASKKAIENVIKRILGKKDDSGKFIPGQFLNSIIRSFVKASTHRQINVIITGLDYNGLKKFRGEVSNRIRGVQQVLDKGRVGQAAKLEVYFAGKTNEFIDELKAKEKALGFQFEIPENFPNKVVLNAKLVGN
jgi:hypothetical protein